MGILFMRKLMFFDFGDTVTSNCLGTFLTIQPLSPDVPLIPHSVLPIPSGEVLVKAVLYRAAFCPARAHTRKYCFSRRVIIFLLCLYADIRELI